MCLTCVLDATLVYCLTRIWCASAVWHASDEHLVHLVHLVCHNRLACLMRLVCHLGVTRLYSRRSVWVSSSPTRYPHTSMAIEAQCMGIVQSEAQCMVWRRSVWIWSTLYRVYGHRLGAWLCDTRHTQGFPTTTATADWPFTKNPLLGFDEGFRNSWKGYKGPEDNVYDHLPAEYPFLETKLPASMSHYKAWSNAGAVPEVNVYDNPVMWPNY